MKFKIILILVLIGLLTMAGIKIKKDWSDNDVRMAVINEQGIVLRSVSWKRRMINELLIDKDVLLWIPKGMGWYKAGELKKIAKQENNPQLERDVLVYNFGFYPDLLGEVEMSWLNNLRYYWQKNGMMIKKESVESDMARSKELLDEILPRDFADDRLLREDVRISVYNWGQSNGLANFVAKILERSGFTILGVDTASIGDESKICLMIFGQNSEQTFTSQMLKTYFKECEVKNDSGLNDGEIELYFGDKYSKMLNYESYMK